MLSAAALLDYVCFKNPFFGVDIKLAGVLLATLVVLALRRLVSLRKAS
jgi:hypothetical protein